MTRRETKTPAKKKPVVDKGQDAPKIPADAGPPPLMVQSLDQQAFQYAMKLIDTAPVTGADAGNIIMLKRELARVAGLQQTQQPG